MPAHTGSLTTTLRPGLFFPNGRVGAGASQSWNKAKAAALALTAALLVAGLSIALAGNFSSPENTRATGASQTFTVSVPARIMANFFIVESAGPDGRAERFLIDTGSSITLVSPEFAERGASSDLANATAELTAPTGRTVEKRRVTLDRLSLGGAHFAQVPAVVSDLGELSNYLGVRIDGIVGFPVFKNYLVTLDYARATLTLALHSADRDVSNRGLVFPLQGDGRVPFVALHVGGQEHEVLIDTGSDGGVNLNPEQLDLQLLGRARPGALVSTVAGDRRQYLGRIADEVRVGGASLKQPVVDFTLGTSSLGGEVLKNFALTFDQRRREVTFRRVTGGDIKLEARRTVGLSFSRSAGSWRVAGVVPETPSAQLALHPGDRCVRINGEAVDRWPAERYAALLNSAERVTFTFARGDSHTDLQIPVVSLLE